MSLRVAYLCGEYPRATDTFIQAEVRELRARGVEIDTISVRPPGARDAGSAEQVEERRRTHYLLPCSPSRLCWVHLSLLVRHPLRYLGTLLYALRVRAPGMRGLIYQLFYFAEAALLVARLRRLGISHVHNHAPDSSGFVALLAARLGRISYSLVIHGHGILADPSRWRLREKLENARFVVCVSHHARSQAMLWSSPAAWPRFHVVRCGISPPADSPTVARRPSQGRLLFVGRLAPVKCLPLLLQALVELRSRAPELELDIVGDGPDRPALELRARELGLASSVHFHGHQSQSDLERFYAAADAVVLSSLFEGVPVVLMEAMARGVPVVAPCVGGIPELVLAGETGLLFAPGDPTSLAGAIERLRGDEGLRDRLALAARAHVGCHFDRHTEGDRLRELFRSYLESQG